MDIKLPITVAEEIKRSIDAVKLIPLMLYSFAEDDGLQASDCKRLAIILDCFANDINNQFKSIDND